MQCYGYEFHSVITDSCENLPTVLTFSCCGDAWVAQAVCPAVGLIEGEDPSCPPQHSEAGTACSVPGLSCHYLDRGGFDEDWACCGDEWSLAPCPTIPAGQDPRCPSVGHDSGDCPALRLECNYGFENDLNSISVCCKSGWQLRPCAVGDGGQLESCSLESNAAGVNNGCDASASCSERTLDVSCQPNTDATSLCTCTSDYFQWQTAAPIAQLGSAACAAAVSECVIAQPN